jgi:hypothetical protein
LTTSGSEFHHCSTVLIVFATIPLQNEYKERFQVRFGCVFLFYFFCSILFNFSLELSLFHSPMFRFCFSPPAPLQQPTARLDRLCENKISLHQPWKILMPPPSHFSCRVCCMVPSLVPTLSLYTYSLIGVGIIHQGCKFVGHNGFAIHGSGHYGSRRRHHCGRRGRDGRRRDGRGLFIARFGIFLVVVGVIVLMLTASLFRMILIAVSVLWMIFSSNVMMIVSSPSATTTTGSSSTSPSNLLLTATASTPFFRRVLLWLLLLFLRGRL